LFLPGEAEQFVIDTELRGEEGVDEGNIVMNAPDLEDFLSAEAELFIPLALFLHILALFPLLAETAGVPAVFDVAQEFQADLVGIEACSGHGDGAGMM